MFSYIIQLLVSFIVTIKNTFLFRLEKVYNLVKEAMPKKPDGQSGVEGVGWAGPHPNTGF